MEEQQHNIDEIFRQGLADYREAPPAAAWDHVERRLDGYQHIKPSFPRGPWMLLVLAVLTGVIGYILWSGSNTHPEKKKAVRVPEHTESTSGTSSLPQENNVTIASSKKHTSATDKSNAISDNNTTTSAKKIKDITGRVVIQSNRASAESRNNYTAESRSIASSSARHSSSRQIIHHRSSGSKSLGDKTVSSTTVSQKQKTGNPKRQIGLIRNREDKGTTKGDRATAFDNQKSRTLPRNAPTKQRLVPRNTTAANEPVRKNTETPENVYARTKQKEKLTAVSAHQILKNRLAESKRSDQNTPGIQPQNGTGFSSQPTKKQVNTRTPGVLNRTRNSETFNNTMPVNKQLPESKKLPDAMAWQAPQLKSTKDENALANKSGQEEGASAAAGTDNEEQTKPVHGHRKRLKLSAPLTLDVLGGYEWGMQKPAPARGVAALRFSVNLNAGFSLGLQPAYRFGNVSSQQLSGTQLFGDVSAARVDSSFTIDTFQVRTNRYIIRQSYDSIRVPALSAGGKIWEIELPLILSYQTANWHIYGGPSFSFGGKIVTTVSSSTQSFTVNRVDTIAVYNSQLPADTFDHYFSSPALTPYSNYKPEKSGDPSSLRIGYILGLGYQWKGFLLDVSLHQQLSGYSNMNTMLQKIYGPYFRISLGYRLFGAPQRKDRTADERKSLQRL
jgi:hypothetical protein